MERLSGGDGVRRVIWTKKRGKRMIGIILLIGLMIVALWSEPVTRNYEIETGKLDADTSIRVVQLSDLHSTMYGGNQERLMKRIDEANPDIILMTGDMIDDVRHYKGAMLLFEELVKRYPVYYTTGNHEYAQPLLEQLLQEMESMGVHMMMDRYETVEVRGQTLRIAGIKDPYAIHSLREREATKQLLEVLDLPEEADVLTLLLAHRPEQWNIYQQEDADVVFSGHAHGGQVRIPGILNGLYSPNQGLFPKLAGGQYADGNKTLIVSRGLSRVWYLPRVFNPPEIVVVDIKGVK